MARAKKGQYKRITFQVAPDGYNHIEEVAKRRGVKLGELIRETVAPLEDEFHGRILNSARALQYSKIVITALEEALDYDPLRQHNQPPPDLRLDDPNYLIEIRSLVAELRRLNELLEKKKSGPSVSRSTGRLAKHFDKFFGSYASALGKGAAGLTIGAAAALLYQAGVGSGVIDDILRHAKLSK
jgi:hypothetical protein